MTEWSVELLGDRRILELLTTIFDSPSCVIAFDEDRQRYLLTLASFHGALGAEEVRSAAQIEIARLSGTLALEGQAMNEPLRIGAVHCIDEQGRSQTFVTCSVSVRLSASAQVVVLDADGNLVVEPEMGRRLVRLRSLLQADEKVTKVSRLIQKPDFKTWPGLYRVFEVIFSDLGGSRGMQDLASASSISRFKRSANHPAVAGDAARHGHSEEEPPPRPMMLSEAENWLRGLVSQWLELKLSQIES